MTTLYSDSSICFKLSTFVAILLKLLSSTKLGTDGIKINNNYRQKNKLNNVGSTIDP